MHSSCVLQQPSLDGLAYALHREKILHPFRLSLHAQEERGLLLVELVKDPMYQHAVHLHDVRKFERPPHKDLHRITMFISIIRSGSGNSGKMDPCDRTNGSKDPVITTFLQVNA